MSPIGSLVIVYKYFCYSDLIFCIDKWLRVTCYTQPCKPCKVAYIMHYLQLGDEPSPRGRWGVCVRALPEVLTRLAVKNAYERGLGL
jgi:hypothetical protein